MKKFKTGSKIKIEDIGPLAVCTQEGKRQIEVELDGVRFWILKRLCKVV